MSSSISSDTLVESVESSAELISKHTTNGVAHAHVREQKTQIVTETTQVTETQVTEAQTVVGVVQTAVV